MEYKEDKVKTEELSLEDTSIQSVPGWEEMPEDFHIRHKLPDQAVYESQELINCISNDPMEVQNGEASGFLLDGK